MAKIHDVRAQLPVPGAWGWYRWSDDVVIVVADDCFTDDDMERIVGYVDLRINGVPDSNSDERGGL